MFSIFNMFKRRYSSFHLSRVAEKDDLVSLRQDWISSCEQSGLQFPLLADKELKKRIGKAGKSGSKAKLNLSKCFLNDDTVSFLINALAKSPIISKLDLRGNPLTDKSVSIIKRLLMGQLAIVKAMDIDKRLHLSFLGECLLDKGNINFKLFQEIETLSMALRKENAKAFIRQTYFDNGSPEHMDLNSINVIWSKVVGKANKSAAKALIENHANQLIQYDELEAALLEELESSQVITEINSSKREELDVIMSSENLPELTYSLPEDDYNEIDLNSDPGNERAYYDNPNNNEYSQPINISVPSNQGQSLTKQTHSEDVTKQNDHNDNSRPKENVLQPNLHTQSQPQKQTITADTSKPFLSVLKKRNSNSSVASNLSSISLMNSANPLPDSSNNNSDSTISAGDFQKEKDKKVGIALLPSSRSNESAPVEVVKPNQLYFESKQKKPTVTHSKDALSNSNHGISQNNKSKSSRVSASIQSNTSTVGISLYPSTHQNNVEHSSSNIDSHSVAHPSILSKSASVSSTTLPHPDKPVHDGVKWGSITAVNGIIKEGNESTEKDLSSVVPTNKPTTALIPNTPPRQKSIDRRSLSPSISQKSPRSPNQSMSPIPLDHIDKLRHSTGGLDSRTSSHSNLLPQSRRHSEKDEISPMRSTFNPQNVIRNAYVPVDIPLEFEKPVDLLSPIITKPIISNDDNEFDEVSPGRTLDKHNISNSSIRPNRKNNEIDYLDFSKKNLKNLSIDDFYNQIKLQEELLFSKSLNHNNITINLDKIHTLILRNNSLTDLDLLCNDKSIINQLVNLYDLDLAGNNFKNLLPNISTHICFKLKRFDISYNHIVDITNILLYQSLEYLNLSHNFINKIVGLPTKSLKFVDLSNNNLCSLLDIRVLSTCEALRILDIRNNPVSKPKPKNPTKEQTKQFVNNFQVIIRSLLPKLEQLNNKILPTHAFKSREKKKKEKDILSHSSPSKEIHMTREEQKQADLQRYLSYQKQLKEKNDKRLESMKQLDNLFHIKIIKSIDEVQDFTNRLSLQSTASHTAYLESVSNTNKNNKLSRYSLSQNVKGNLKSDNKYDFAVKTKRTSSPTNNSSTHKIVGPNYNYLIREWVDINTNNLSKAVNIFPILFILMDSNDSIDKTANKLKFDRLIESLSFYPKVIIPTYIDQYIHNSLPPSVVHNLDGEYSIAKISNLIHSLRVFNGLIQDISFSLNDIMIYDPKFESLKSTIDILMKTKDGNYINTKFLIPNGFDYDNYPTIRTDIIDQPNEITENSNNSVMETSNIFDSNITDISMNISNNTVPGRSLHLLNELEVSRRMDDVKRRISIKAGKLNLLKLTKEINENDNSNIIDLPNKVETSIIENDVNNDHHSRYDDAITATKKDEEVLLIDDIPEKNDEIIINDDINLSHDIISDELIPVNDINIEINDHSDTYSKCIDIEINDHTDTHSKFSNHDVLVVSNINQTDIVEEKKNAIDLKYKESSPVIEVTHIDSDKINEFNDNFNKNEETLINDEQSIHNDEKRSNIDETVVFDHALDLSESKEVVSQEENQTSTDKPNDEIITGNIIETASCNLDEHCHAPESLSSETSYDGNHVIYDWNQISEEYSKTNIPSNKVNSEESFDNSSRSSVSSSTSDSKSFNIQNDVDSNMGSSMMESNYVNSDEGNENLELSYVNSEVGYSDNLDSYQDYEENHDDSFNNTKDIDNEHYIDDIIAKNNVNDVTIIESAEDNQYTFLESATLNNINDPILKRPSYQEQQVITSNVETSANQMESTKSLTYSNQSNVSESDLFSTQTESNRSNYSTNLSQSSQGDSQKINDEEFSSHQKDFAQSSDNVKSIETKTNIVENESKVNQSVPKFSLAQVFTKIDDDSIDTTMNISRKFPSNSNIVESSETSAKSRLLARMETNKLKRSSNSSK